MGRYLIGSVAIGAMQVADEAILFKNAGVCGDVSLVLSLVEFGWAIVSLIVLIRTKHTPTRVLAVTFLAYNAFGWILSFSVPQATEVVVVPIWFVIFGGIFGMLYGAASAYAARHP